jgi:hypothetical protein
MEAWNHVSASQIKTYRRCSRKWWFEKIAGHRSPTSAAAELGRQLHAQLENYLLTGELPESPIARAGLKHLPSQGEKILVEESLEYKKGLPVPLIGFIDLVELENRRVTDHKTTSDFKWAKNEYELLMDPQAIIYTKIAKDQFFEGDEDIEFRHVYYRTRGAAASSCTTAVFSTELLEEQFEGIVQTVLDMSEDSRQEKPAGVSFNPEACSDYGGCPFRGECATLGVKTYGLLSGLFKKQGEKSMASPWSKLKKKAPQPAPPQVMGGASKRTREQVESMIRLLAPEDSPAVGDMSKLDMEGLLKLESKLSARQAKKVFNQSRVNPPDGTPMDRRVEVAMKQKAPDQKITVDMDGGIHTTTTRPAGDKAKGYVVNGRTLSSMNKAQLVEAYWLTYTKMDDLQRAGWLNASDISSEVLSQANDRGPIPVKAVEIKEDLRLMLEILSDESVEGQTETFKKVAAVVAKTHVADPEALEVVPQGLKVMQRGKNNLPPEMGGTPLSKIRAADYPAVFRQVVFDFFDQSVVEEWMTTESFAKCETQDKKLRQWIYDGCLDKHTLKRALLKNALTEFLMFEETSGVPRLEVDVESNASPPSEAVPETPAPEEPEEQVEDEDSGMVNGFDENTVGKTLFIGCMPMNEQVVFLHTFLRPYQERVEEDAAVPHYGMIKYNEGPKRVAALLRQEAHTGDLDLPHTLVCDRGLPCADVVLEVLKPLYSRVVDCIG